MVPLDPHASVQIGGEGPECALAVDVRGDESSHVDSPSGGVFLYMRPAEGGGYQAARSSHSRVMNIVQRPDGGLAELGG